MNFTLKAGDLHKGLARDPFRDSRQLARLSTQLSISDSTYILAYTSVYTRLRTTHIDTNFCLFAYTPSTFRSPPHALILFTHIYRHAHIRTGRLQHRMLIFCPCHSPSAVVNPYSCTVDDPTTVQSCLPSCLHITAMTILIQCGQHSLTLSHSLHLCHLSTITAPSIVTCTTVTTYLHLLPLFPLITILLLYYLPNILLLPFAITCIIAIHP